jgi:hypothetical protein
MPLSRAKISVFAVPKSIAKSVDKYRRNEPNIEQSFRGWPNKVAKNRCVGAANRQFHRVDKGEIIPHRPDFDGENSLQIGANCSIFQSTKPQHTKAWRRICCLLAAPTS